MDENKNEAMQEDPMDFTEDKQSNSNDTELNSDTKDIESVNTEDTINLQQDVETKEERIEKLESQSAEYLDKYQRCFAEFDNFRKRTLKEKASMYDDGVKDTIEKLLPVIDNLERALSIQDENLIENNFYKGIEMILKQFQEILVGLGVEEIKALGEKFDPNFHAAVAHEDNDDYAENEVILEMLKGYKYKEKVIRHSMVKVAN